MGTRPNAALVARLELRHLHSDLRFLLFAAGVDIDEDRGFLERTYQLYLAVIGVAVVALSWAQVLSLVEGARWVLGSQPGTVALALLALAPALALALWAVSDLRETPLRLAAPDIAWLARVVRPGALLAVRLVLDLAPVVACGAIGGQLLGVLALAPSPLAWAALLASLMFVARLLALVAGLARSAAPHRRRFVVAVAAGALAVLLAAALALSVPVLIFVLGLVLVPAALAVGALLVVLALWLAARADMAFVVDDNELYAARRALRFLALANAGAYKEACRRRRLGRRRQVRRTWRFWRGPGAYVSHALVSLARDLPALLGILSWSALVVPGGALLVGLRPDVGVLLVWYLFAVTKLRDPLELAHVFRADCANRLVRPMLPAPTLRLLALDSLPAALVAAVASAIVAGGGAALLSADVLGTVALSWAMLAALVLSAGFDDPRIAARGGASPTVFLSGAASLFAVGLAGLLGTVPALACALLADVLLAWLLRD